MMSLNKPPKVSVIIPNYNHATYLNRRINSVLNQSYQDFELIILDDFSTDNSREIIENYRNHSKIRHIIFNKKNSGSTFKQWNKGVNLAKGEYVWIAESDDFADVSFLKKTVELLNSNNKINLCFTQSYRVDHSDNITEHCLSWYDEKFVSPFSQNGNLYIKEYLWEYNNIYNASAVVFKKSAYPHNQQSIEKLKFVGDWFIYIKLIENGDIAYIPDALNQFRHHDTSVTAKFNNSKIHLVESYFVINYIIRNKLYYTLKKLNTRLNYLAGQILIKNLTFQEKLKIVRYVMKFDYIIVIRLMLIKIKSFKK